MKETGLMFKAPLVRSILDGSKTQTRRIAKEFAGRDDLDAILRRFPNQNGCPYGGPGDHIYVREAWAPNAGSAGGFLYRADHGGAASFSRCDLKTGVWTHSTSRWWPSIHMPKHAARIWLDITGVRLERLQDISRGDAMAEGCPFQNMADGPDPRKWFAELWTSTGGDWAANPWVWVIDFKRIHDRKATP